MTDHARPDYDSRFLQSTMTIIVRVHLDPTPAGSAIRPQWAMYGPIQPAQPWPGDSFANWRRTWRRTIMTAWDNKFVLVPHARLVPGQGNPPPVIRCRLELRVNGVDSNYNDPPHLRISVANGVNNRSVNRVGGNDNQVEYDSYLKESDVRSVPVGRMGVRQTQAIHEFGHHLGLIHRCGILLNNQYCDRHISERLGDIMAEGDDLQSWHGDPWLRRIPNHVMSGLDIWHVRLGDEISVGVQPAASREERQQAMRGEAGLTPEELDRQGTRMNSMEIFGFVAAAVFTGLATTAAGVVGALAAAGEI